MSEVMTKAQWQEASAARAKLYRWFADMLARELKQATIIQWQQDGVYDDIHQVFCALGLEAQSLRLKDAFARLYEMPKADRGVELAADFAQLFLLGGDDCAPPYASFYTQKDKQLFGKPAEVMHEFLDRHDLALHPDFKEPKDHISVYFMVMSLWIDNSADEAAASQASIETSAGEQATFLQTALLTWLPQFAARVQNIRPVTDVYPALVTLADAFVTADEQALNEMSTADA